MHSYGWLCAIGLIGAGGFVSATSGATYTTLNVAGAGTQSGAGTTAQAINLAGSVTGYYKDSGGIEHGFVWINGKYKSFDASAGSNTAPSALNDAGTITGIWYPVGSSYAHGFVRDAGGSVTLFDGPNGAYSTSAFAINKDGFIAGDASNGTPYGYIRKADGHFTTVAVSGARATIGISINDSWVLGGHSFDQNFVAHAFVKTWSGSTTMFDAPGAGSAQQQQGTYAPHLNSAGVGAGQFVDAKNVSHGYIRTTAGAITAFDVPKAGTGAYQGTVPTAINRAGVVTGFYIDANGADHGFIRKPNGTIRAFNVPGSGTGSRQGSVPHSINNDGVVSGVYVDSANVNHGFVRTP